MSSIPAQNATPQLQIVRSIMVCTGCGAEANAFPADCVRIRRAVDFVRELGAALDEPTPIAPTPAPAPAPAPMPPGLSAREKVAKDIDELLDDIASLGLAALEKRKSQIVLIKRFTGYRPNETQMKLLRLLEQRLREKKEEHEAARRRAQQLIAAGTAVVH
jgi:hypothetical protein